MTNLERNRRAAGLPPKPSANGAPRILDEERRAARNGPPPGKGDAYEGDLTPVEPPSPPRFKFIDSAEFLAGDYRPRWLIPRILVKGEPAAIAGPSKGMKTSFLIEAAVSMATATPFLGKFPVRERARVAVVSGESGRSTLQDLFRRVLTAKQIDGRETHGWLKWEFTLPTFANLEVMHDFATELAVIEADVAMIDPMYMSLGSVDARNVFEMGEALRIVVETLQKLRPNLTIVIAHHANRQLSAGEPMELQHLAYSGLEQFARQWILMNRREPYRDDGSHKLWVRASGSAGHGGLWGVDIEEGLTDENFQGRRWDVKVLTLDELKGEEAAVRDSSKREKRLDKMERENAAVLAAIDAEVANGAGGASLNRIREIALFSYDLARGAVNRLLESGAIEETEFSQQFGNGAARAVKGFKRTPE